MRDDGDEASWSQVEGYRRLSAGLEAHYRRMLLLRGRIAQAWDGDAAAKFIGQFDRHAVALGQDALCADATARALYGVTQTLVQAQRQLARLDETWRSVTTDWKPELFDHAASEADAAARQVMLDTDRALRDYRATITAPAPAETVDVADRRRIRSDGFASASEQMHTTAPAQAEPPSQGGVERTPVPPLPGIDPVLDGPGLAGAPVPVKPSTATPPSVLPIPPYVSELALHGGGYILPGPWVGSGRVLAMPTAVRGDGAGSTGRGGLPSARGGAVGGPAGTVMTPGAGAPGGGDRGARRQRMGTEHWKVDEGVPPVIGDAGPFHVDEEGPDPYLLETFEQWYAHVATPWDAAGRDVSPTRPGGDA